MSMFCFQCQETAGCKGCTVRGVCGKTEDVAKIQDLLIFVTKGLATVANEGRKVGIVDKKINRMIIDNLFITITNANFDFKAIEKRVKDTLVAREELKERVQAKGGNPVGSDFKGCATWTATTSEEMMEKASQVGVLATENEDIRSLRELIMYGLKGLAAYME
ncbi:MAG: hydroxylamine reductase, partial [Clostridium perfringens]